MTHNGRIHNEKSAKVDETLNYTIQMKLNNKKGFTLIELLVVIAIIGLLAGIVLVSLSGARDQAKEARMITNMGQYRSAAEIQFSADSDYDDVGVAAEFVTLSADITAQGGTNFAINKPATPAASYCAEVQLNAADWYCVDSTFVSKKYSAAPSCAAADFTCD